jgi:tRNA pseudouridine38-40 synthase
MSRTPSRLTALWCWYHGARFRGYQAQADAPTVQATLWEALEAAGIHRKPVASGRTDAGVHARMHVLSLRVPLEITLEDVPARLNAHLPPDVGIALAKPTPPHFNAHWRTTAKEYRYRLLVAERPSWSPFAWRVALRPERLTEPLALAVGTHDFSAFHDQSSVVRPRTLTSVEVVEADDGLVEVRLRGDGFGRYMVRALVGGAVSVARGEWSQAGFSEALARGASGPRRSALERAPANGLVLWNVEYDEKDDPFTADERREAPNVPDAPPFLEVALSPSSGLRTSPADR